MRHTLGRLLIVGAGPAAFQTAALLQKQCSCLGIASRSSQRWQRHNTRLLQGEHVQIQVAKPSLVPLTTSVAFDKVFEDLSAIRGQWDTVVVATPSYALTSVLQALPAASLTSVQEVVLLSSWFGGHQMAQGYFAELGLSPNMVVFSNYYAATKFAETEDILNVITKAVKKRVYAHVSQQEAGALARFREALEDVDTQIETLASGFSVEGRNITLYVHPAFFISPFVLEHIFRPGDEKKYMYKLFPEGPITPATIRTLVALWRDLSTLIRHLGGTPFNLLQFLNDDNYPVREETLSRQQIDSFMHCSTIEQEYRLYVRYSAILIDPFSTPDEQGRYFDFSAVPFAKGSLERDEWPRIPSEDVYALYWLQAVAAHVGLTLPTVRRVLDDFEHWLHARQLPNQFMEVSRYHATHGLRWLAPALGE